MESTPDTTFYMTLGYAIFFIVSAIYLASLLLRHRNLKRDLDLLEKMDRKN